MNWMREMDRRATMQKVYAAAQTTCGLKKGDLVMVLRKAESYEAGWDCSWNPDMNDLVGKAGLVIDMFSNSVRVHFYGKKNSWNFPYFVLEKMAAPEPAYEFKPFDKVLVRDADNEQWKASFFSNYTDIKFCPFQTTTRIYMQCIPYRGNERLLGKTDRPDCEPDGKTGERNSD